MWTRQYLGNLYCKFFSNRYLNCTLTFKKNKKIQTP